MGQPPLGVALGGPRVAEVNVDEVHLIRGKNAGRLAASASIKKTLCSSMSRARSMAMTMASGTRSTATNRTSGAAAAVWQVKRPLPHPQLDPELLGSGQQGAPVAPQSLGVRNQPLGTPLHPGHQILFSSHTHWVSSSDGRRKLAKPRGVSSLSGYHTISFSLCQRLSPDFHPSPVIFPLSKGQKSGMIKGTKSGKEGACHGCARGASGPNEAGIFAGRAPPFLRAPGAGAPPILLPPPGETSTPGPPPAGGLWLPVRRSGRLPRRPGQGPRRGGRTPWSS